VRHAQAGQLFADFTAHATLATLAGFAGLAAFMVYSSLAVSGSPHLKASLHYWE